MRRLIALCAVVGLVILTGCNSQPPIVSDKGVSFSPASLDATGITDFFFKAQQSGGIVTWQGDWQQLSNQNSSAYVILKSAAENHYIPIIVVQAFDNATGVPLHALDDTTTQSYIANLKQLAADYKPQYLGIGVEVNMLHTQSPQQFSVFVNLFNSAYDAVKTVSPATQVFTIFQLEQMKGLHGGLFGGTNDSSQSQWDILDQFVKADMFAFTTYPGIIYNNPADIPDDYISDIAKHTAKPFAISETGWFRTAPAGWDGSSAQEQADYIYRLAGLISTARPQFTIWSFLYDPDTPSPIFKSMGLLAVGEDTSPAWTAWNLLP